MFGSVELFLDLLKLLRSEATVNGTVEQFSIKERFFEGVVNSNTVGSKSFLGFVLLLLIDGAVGKVIVDYSMPQVSAVYIVLEG